MGSRRTRGDIKQHREQWGWWKEEDLEEMIEEEENQKKLRFWVNGKEW